MLAIFFGISWGFIEATLGGAMHFFNLPWTGPVIGSIGCTILYLALKRGVRVQSLLVIPLIAAGMKFFDLFLFRLSLNEVTVVRPAIAILLQGCTFTLVATIDKNFAIKRLPIYAAFIATASTLGFAALYGSDIRFSLLYSSAMMTMLTTALIYAIHSFEGILQKLTLRPVSAVALSVILVVVSVVARSICS